MPKVFVIQAPSRPKDLSSAQRYGAIHFIFNDPTFQPSQSPGVASNLIGDALADFNPDTDYLLALGGDLVGILMVGHILREMYPGRPTSILRWERERDTSGKRVEGAGFYVPCVIRW